MKLDKDNIKKIRGLILFTVFILVALWNYKLVLDGLGFLWGVILPFVLGGGIAFLINIPMNFFERKLFAKSKKKEKKWAMKLARPISLIVTLVVIFGIVTTIMLILIPQLGQTITKLSQTIELFIPQVQEWAIKTFRNHEDLVGKISNINFNWESILGSGVDFLKNGAGNVISSTYEFAKGIISGATTFFIALVFACYILIQKETLERQVKKLFCAFMPEDWRNILFAMAEVTSKTFTHFFTGQCLEAVLLGLMFLVVMAIFQMPYALLISVLIAFTALIPIFGAFIGCAIGALLILMVSPVKALIFIIIFLVLQQIEGNFVYPHVVGNSVGLPSIWVIVAVTVGANMMGIVGMLIFIPLTSVVYTLLRGIVNRRLGLKE